MDPNAVISHTRRWIASMVIELNLCPFAQRVFDEGLIRFVVSNAEDEGPLLKELARELESLAAAPITAIETTLLIVPCALDDFFDYNAFLDAGQRLIVELGLRGDIQIASFHPLYQFADQEPDAVENFTNRSPYPMLHLLREESFARIAGDSDDVLAIPKRNMQTLRQLGSEKILQRLAAIRENS